MDRKELPSGIDVFSKIREGNYYYVDKTAFIARLAMKEGHYFLSRPRRFGKTLLVDTLENLFRGNKELFEGLAIYDKWNWAVKYPVVRFRFGRGNFNQPGELERIILEQLTDLEDGFEVKPKHGTASGRFAYLLKELAREKKQRVVVLVDEYDKPIFSTLETPELSKANRDYLSGFYSTIKDCNEHIHFTFLTGVSKFAHAGIFSGLNNLTDITLDPEFSLICGYTDHDLDAVFAPEIENLAHVNITRDEIKEWYNGYSWRSQEKVYNPFSILQLFVKREFYSWWFDTGTPSFLIEALKQRGGIGTLDLTGIFEGNELLSSIDIGNIEVPALLFQTGYLTIARERKSGGEALYQLDFPNREVRQSLHQRLLRAIAPNAGVAQQTRLLREALVSGNFDDVKAHLQALFSDISYTTYNPAARTETYEGHYASNAHTCLAATGLVVRPEDSTSKGRIDMTVEAGTRIVIFEFKVLGEKVKRGDAMNQLHERKYADKYRARGMPIHLVGFEISPEERNIKHFDIEDA